MVTVRARPAGRAPAWLLALVAGALGPVCGARAALPAPSPQSPAGAAAPAGAPDPRALTYAPLSISFPKPEKVFLPDGLLVYLFEDHELPLVDAAIDFKAGSIFDPPDKAGLASLAATLMPNGGTEPPPPHAIDAAPELIAARLDSGSR